jgi:hypothetical protein
LQTGYQAYPTICTFFILHIKIFFNFSALINKHIRMNKLLLALLAICLLGACKSKHKKGPGDAFTLEDFRQLFNNRALPYKLTPDSLKIQQADSLAIAPELLSQFLTDTLAKADYPAGTELKFFPLAYFEGTEINYFVVKATGKTATTAYLCITDKKGHYLSRMPVAIVSGKGHPVKYFSVDSKQVLKITEEKELAGSRTSTKEEFYDIKADGKSMLMMTNSSGEAAAGQIFNPIDSLAGKNKLSGDYEAGELSLVSIRDGNDPKSFQFFISFSRESSGCKGELSGVGHFISANKGEYKDKETSCGISFQFSAGGRLSIKEIGGCGAYRGVRCFFEGNYSKKK